MVKLRNRFLFWLLLWLLPSSLFGVDTLKDNLEFTTAITGSYGSRNLFTNPAALGFETELNGVHPLTSFATSLNKNQNNDYSFAFALGWLGFGFEHLIRSSGELNRYSFGLGMPFSPYLYYGLRYRFTSSNITALNGYNALDMGVQIRPSSTFSIGLLAEGINQPSVGGSTTPTRFTAGLLVAPLDPVRLTVDVTTNSNNFLKSVGYEANAEVEVLRGLRIRGGYHHERRWQIGLQLNFGLTSYFSAVQPQTPAQSVLVGVQFSSKPYPSPISFHSGLEMTVNSNVAEEPINGGLLGADRPSLLHLLQRLDRARKQPGVEIVLIDLKSFPLGLAAAYDLAEAILETREAGKQVEVFLGNAGLKEYLIASAADRIYMEAGAELRLAGLRDSRYYLKGTLDKLGVEGELFAKGKYKSAPEMFTRKGPSAASREASVQRLRSTERAVLSFLQENRKLSEKKWKEVLEYALFSPEDAKQWELIDSIEGYPTRKEKINALFSETLDLQRSDIALPPRIAVIVASGDILQGRSAFLSFTGSPQITYKKIEQHVEQALSDPLTKAIVLRVSSPGGEVLPSQQIASLIERAKEKKPILVSMGDSAASGGYMISAPADEIFAAPTTQTGSIGVFLGKVNLAELYKKIDLHKEIITDHPYADLYSEDRGLSAGGKKILTRRLDQYYDSFVDYVAKQRQLPLAKVAEQARGRVWTGTEAKENKLIDKVGSYLDVVHAAAERVGLLPGTYEYYVVESPPSLFSPFGDAGWLRASTTEKMHWPWPVLRVAEQLHWASLLKDRPFLYLSPTGLVD